MIESSSSLQRNQQKEHINKTTIKQMKLITLHGTGYFDKVKYLRDNHIEIVPIDWEKIFIKTGDKTKNAVGLIIVDKRARGKMRTDLLMKLNKSKKFKTVYLVCEEKVNLKYAGQKYIDFPRSYDESEQDYLKGL